MSKLTYKTLGQYQHTIYDCLLHLFKRDLSIFVEVYSIDIIKQRNTKDNYILSITTVDVYADLVFKFPKHPAKDAIDMIKEYIDKNFNFEFLDIKKEYWEEEQSNRDCYYCLRYSMNEEQLETFVGYCRLNANI